VNFWNKLPDLPFHPKFLACPLSTDRYTQYKIDNSLERSYKHEILPDLDVGVNLDLIDLSLYAIPRDPATLDPADARLISGLLLFSYL
jgi:RNA polymerase II-associated factor 1